MTFKQKQNTRSKNNKIKRRILVLLCFCAFVLSVNIASSQVTGSVSVRVSPESPGAFQEVTASLASYSIDLNRAQITWVVKGKVELSGIGKKEFSFKTGAVGSSTTVNVSITTSSGVTIDRKIVVQPSEIDLLWEANDSYVPPFYKGKALPSSEASIKVVAMPNIKINGTKLKPQNLVYTWERDDKRVPAISGHGKNSFLFKNSYLDSKEVIDVDVSSLDNNSEAHGRVAINIYMPKILFYEDNLLEGINYRYALNRGFDMRSDRATIVAEPYFFSPRDIKSPDLDYNWSVNNRSVATPEDKNSLFLRLEEGQGGIARISLSIESISKLFLSADADMTINLGD